MRSRCMSLLPRTTLHSDSEQYSWVLFQEKLEDVGELLLLFTKNWFTLAKILNDVEVRCLRYFERRSIEQAPAALCTL